jgi:hypothetical protein
MVEVVVPGADVVLVCGSSTVVEVAVSGVQAVTTRARARIPRRTVRERSIVVRLSAADA